MTTAATIAGMTPVALAMSEGGEMRAPMAVAAIGGLITSTLLTLVVVPVVYTLLDGASVRFRRWLGMRGGQAVSVPADALEESPGSAP